MRPREKDLRDLIAATEVNQGTGHVIAFEYSSLNVQITRKIQMPFHRLAIRRRQAG